MKKIHNLVGQTFGKLTVVELSHRKNPHTYWVCACACGGQTLASTNNLRRGKHNSCGCGHKESKNISYGSWYNMLLRCGYIKGYPAQKNYTNVKVCSEWFDIKAFLRDMGDRPSVKHSIDRINPNGNYEPSNCRWATKQTQARNKRRHASVRLPNGETLTVWEYAEMVGLSYKSAWGKADKLGYLQKLTELTKEKNGS